jgi:tetratricopeptide (TPR) repeat protein
LSCVLNPRRDRARRRSLAGNWPRGSVAFGREQHIGEHRSPRQTAASALAFVVGAVTPGLRSAYRRSGHMRIAGLMVVLISTAARAGGELEPDDLPGPKPEVATGEAKVDLPAVPSFELPAVEPGFHGVRELRVHGRPLQGSEVRVKGYVTSIYDCVAVLAITRPQASHAELLLSIDNDPRQCERPRFYLGDAKGASREASIWVVDVPRLPAKPERDAMSPAELAQWPAVPKLAVGDYLIVTGTWSTRSPHNERNTGGLLIYKALGHAVPDPARSTIATPSATAPDDPEIAVVTRAPLRKYISVITRNASVDHLNACNKAITAQQYDAGIAKCEQAIAVWDGNHLAWYGVASAHLARSEWAEARVAAERAVALRPDEAMYQLYYGIALYEDARAQIEHKKPDDASALQLSAARDALWRATKRAPELWRAHYYLGRVYGDLDDARRAAEQLTRAIATHPSYRASYLALIELYRRWQYVDQALAVATIGLRSVPPGDARELWFAAGMAYDETHADDQAIAAFTRALAAKPEDKQSKFQRGQVYLRKGDLASAKRDLEDVVKSPDPQLGDATSIAAQLLIQIVRKRRDTPKTFDCRNHGRCVVDDDVEGGRR